MAIYLSRKKGGTVATPITPSNSSPAQMTADTPVNPTANGYAIASYNTKTPSNSSPVALASGEIDKIGGNGYAIESYSSVTPSNSSPERIYEDDPIIPSGDGYAIRSYNPIIPGRNPYFVPRDEICQMMDDGYVVNNITQITPSNSSPERIIANDTYYALDDGYAIESYDNVTPNNSNPVTLTSGDIIKVSGNGKAVSSITEITPSGDAIGFQSNSIVKFDGFGYIINTYTSVSPSNSSPVTLSDGEYYKMSGAGKAVASVTSKTPSDSSPASVSSGAIIKASSSGYLYSSSGLGQYVNITNTASKDETFNLSAGSTTSISVTSKPKLILWFSGNYGSGVSAGYGEMGMYDGIRNKYRRVTYYSSGGNTSTDGGDITSVTSSTVSFKNNGSTYRRYHVMMWY